MEDNLYKYFAGELISEEKEKFLYEVNNNEKLREEFIEYQNIVALVDWLYPESNEELAQRKLSEFMSRIEKQ